MVPPVAGNAFYAFANFRARPLAKVRTDLEAECGCAAAIRNLLEGENSAHASAVAVLRETHNEALISHSSSIEALEGISKPSDGTPTRLQQESEIQGTNRALVNMGGRELENARFSEMERHTYESLIADCQKVLFDKGHQAQTGRSTISSPTVEPSVQRQLATSTALTDANAKVIEHQAHIDHLKQRINQLVQTLTDDLTGQQLERLRTKGANSSETEPQPQRNGTATTSKTKSGPAKGSRV
ncbi:hypothetical protein GX48_05113 [Paracoccidioides brasiliensis]|nr:hypothetical protein GX48_05113 [Paracoccidioides brasiliensis]